MEARSNVKKQLDKVKKQPRTQSDKNKLESRCVCKHGPSNNLRLRVHVVAILTHGSRKHAACMNQVPTTPCQVERSLRRVGVREVDRLVRTDC